VESQNDGVNDIGERIREGRKSKGLTLKELSESVGVTPSFLSQLENGKVAPSLSTLRKILSVLGERMVTVLQDETDEKKFVVKANERKKLIVSDKLWYEILSTKNSSIAMFLMYLEPGYGSGIDFYSHEGVETGLMLQGKVKIFVGDKEFVLNEGDSITYNSTTPHRWENIGEKRAIGIWSITPPSF